MKYLGSRHNKRRAPFNIGNHEIHSENVAFTFKSTLFIDLHIVLPSLVQKSFEWEAFERQNCKWIFDQVAKCYDQVQAVVLFAHAFPNQDDYPTLWEELNDVADLLPEMPLLGLQGDDVQ